MLGTPHPQRRLLRARAAPAPALRVHLATAALAALRKRFRARAPWGTGAASRRRRRARGRFQTARPARRGTRALVAPRRLLPPPLQTRRQFRAQLSHSGAPSRTPTASQFTHSRRQAHSPFRQRPAYLSACSAWAAVAAADTGMEAGAGPARPQRPAHKFLRGHGRSLSARAARVATAIPAIAGPRQSAPTAAAQLSTALLRPAAGAGAATFTIRQDLPEFRASMEAVAGEPAWKTATNRSRNLGWDQLAAMVGLQHPMSLAAAVGV